MKPNMRTEWFGHVSRTRARMSKKEKKTVSHQAAMAEDSKTWAKEKEKVQRKFDRKVRREAKALKSSLNA